jgi:hypothetical protein
MSPYWTNFTKSGDPNSSGLPQWPVWNPSTKLSLETRDDHSPLCNPGSREVRGVQQKSLLHDVLKRARSPGTLHVGDVNGSGDGYRGGVIGSLVEPRTQTCLEQRQEIRG